MSKEPEVPMLPQAATATAPAADAPEALTPAESTQMMNDLRADILAGNDPSPERLRTALAALRQSRISQGAYTASKSPRTKKPPPTQESLDALFNDL